MYAVICFGSNTKLIQTPNAVKQKHRDTPKQDRSVMCVADKRPGSKRTYTC
jgi:hypothetical protein